MVLVYTGTSPLGEPILNALNDFLKQQNNVGDAEVVTLEKFDLQRIYANLDPTAAKKISITIGLSEWGMVKEPFAAFYGQVKLSDVANWSHHGKFLFDKNLRFYRGTTEVNDAMDETINVAPDHFWYFNNGITILCDAITKAPLNAEDNTWGVFECAGVSVVNGAQTVGVIWEGARQQPDFFAGLNARVHLRIVSLENCPPEFGRQLTRATNTQNEIRHRDFAALDDTQRIIAREMELDGRRYAYKSGDIDPRDTDGCTIEEATIALACAAGDVTMAVAAKRELGSLWRDIYRPPYTTIFNEKTRARDVWRAVVVSRAVQDTLNRLDLSALDRGDQIAVHGNRFILYLVFEDPGMQDYKDLSISDDATEAEAAAVAERAFRRVADAVNKKHANAYLQPLFKNAQKCRDLFLEPSPEAQIEMILE